MVLQSRIDVSAHKTSDLLNTTCDTASFGSSDDDDDHGVEDVASPLPHLDVLHQSFRSGRRRSLDLKVASQARDVRYILHKMRQGRADVHLQMWAVDALRKLQAEDIEDGQVAEEITENIIRGSKRHPYSQDLQHKVILSLCHLGKTDQRIKDRLVTPERMDILFSSLHQAQQNELDKNPEVYVAIFSLFAVGFDQFDHSALVDEGAIASIVEILQQLKGNHEYSTETIFEWGTLALEDLSWLCEDMSVPQVFPKLTETIQLVVAAMNRYPHNSNIQNSCGEILRHIMKNDPDAVHCVKAAGGAEALILALHNHLDREDVLVEGCLTLTHFMAFADLRDKCFTTVLATMAQHVGNGDVQLGGCAFLADATENTSNSFRFLFDATQAVPLLMTAMETHPANERLQEYGCRAFQTLGRWIKDRSERKRFKIMGLVVGAMKTHSTEYCIQLYGCKAIQAMVSSWGDDATVFMVKVGGIKCLQATIGNFVDDAEIVVPGLAILGNLNLLECKFARCAVMKGTCIQVLMDGIKRHRGHQKVQELGGLVIDMLAKVSLESCQNSERNRTGDCCIRCLKISLTSESSERWQGCSCQC